MYEFMGELQEQAFKELEPEAWDSITKRLTHLREGGGNMVARISSNIRLLLGRDGIEAEVNGREKKPYSIWRKMQERHIPFEQLSNVIAVRVIVDSVEACYRELGSIHRHWTLVQVRIKTFISTPNHTGSPPLHTTVHPKPTIP